MPKIYSLSMTVPQTAIDANGHVNNVTYVQWMQDVAIKHSHEQGATEELYRQLGTSWIIRSHFIEYKRPAFAGDEIEVLTWVANIKKARSKRKYRFVRAGDAVVLATAETDWVYVNASSGRPLAVDEAMQRCFVVVPADEEPK